MVVDCGESVTHVVPIKEGECITEAVESLNIAGSDITKYLQTMLNQRGYLIDADAGSNSIATSQKISLVVKDIKEQLSFIAVDDNINKTKTNSEIINCNQEYELPDGKKIVIGNERFRCCEILFKPNLIGIKCKGIDQLIHDSIAKSNINISYNISKNFFNNIVLSGGTTMIPNIKERIKIELENNINNNINNVSDTDCVKVKVIAPANRKYSTWVGGSILSSLSYFEEMWISRDDYNQIGPDVVHRKCV